MKTASSFLDRLTGSRFRRNTFVLVRANVVTQALLLLATPILTRLFSPEDFGIAGLFVISAALFGAVASWRFEWSIPSAATQEDAQDLTTLSLFLVFASALLLQIMFTIPDQKALFGLVGMEPIPFAPLVPSLAFATSTMAILSSAYVRVRSMEAVSHAKYAQNGTQLVGSLAAGFSAMGAFGLVLSHVLGVLAGAMTMLRGFPFRLVPSLGNIRGLFRTGRRYLSEASLSTAVSVVNFAFGNCLPLLLLLGYSVREVGFYFVAMRLAGGPTALLSSGISSSFWGEAAALAKTDPARLRRMYIKVISTLALLTILIAAACLSAPLFLPALLGGSEWSEIGLVVAACLPQIAGTFIFSSTNHLIVYGRQGYQLISDLLSIVGSVAVLWFAMVWELPFSAAILGMSCVILLAYLLRFSLHLKANSEAMRAVAPL